MRTAAAACLALALLTGRDAHAQTTIGIAAGASRQEPGDSDIPYLGPAYGGTVAAVVGMIDFRLSNRATVGGEVSFPAALSADQSQRSSSRTLAFTSRHRDTLLNGVLKYGLPLDRRIHAAAAVGAGLAYRRTARSGTSAPLFPPSTRSDYDEVVSDYVLAYEFGGDVDVRVTSRLRVLGIARWHRLHDDDRDSGGVVKRGVSSSIFRAGAGLKLAF
jgi:hypothetical protein